MPNPAAIHEAIDNLQLRLYKLTTKSHLRIGAGEGSISLSAADNPVIQALFFTPPPPNGSPGQQRVIYLPGSSLHGVIRAWAEKVHRSMTPFLTREQLEGAMQAMADGQGEQLKEQARNEVNDYLGHKADDDDLFAHWRVHPVVCDPLSPLDQCQRFGQSSEAQATPAKQAWFNTLHERHGRNNPCPICQVFGYVGQRGRVRVHNAFPAEGGLPLDIITRVAINRISGAADEGKLYDVEAIPPGAVFYFYVVLENMNADQVRTFDYGIQALRLQLATLGAHSTVGFGVVEVEQVMAADIRPTLFSQTDLPDRIRQTLPSLKRRPAAANIDAARYPTFFNALSMVDGSGAPAGIFGDSVTITHGGK